MGKLIDMCDGIDARSIAVDNAALLIPYQPLSLQLVESLGAIIA